MDALELDSLRHRVLAADVGDVDLDTVAEALPLSARRLFKHLATFSRARTVDDLLSDPKVQRVYDLLARDRQTHLLETLGHWLVRASETRPPRPRADAEPELVRWAREHGVERYLDRPMAEIAPFTGVHGYWYADVLRRVEGATVRTAATGRAHATGLSAKQLTSAAEEYLARAATEQTASAVRAERWSRIPEEPVLERLMHPLRELETQLADDVVFASPVEPLTFDATALVIRAGIPMSSDWVTLSLAAHEDGVLTLGGRGARGAYHLSLVRDLLDVVVSPDHPVHARLAETLAMPTWSRLLQAVDGALTEMPAPQGRLAFAVESGPDGSALVEPIWQTRTSKGWNRGRRHSLSRLDATNDPHERMAMIALLSRAYGTNEADAIALAALEGHETVVDADTRTPLEVRRVEASFAFCEDGDVLRPGVALGSLRFHSEALESLARNRIVARVDLAHRAVLVATISAELRALLEIAVQIPAKASRADTAAILPVIERAAMRMSVVLPAALEDAVVALEPRLLVRLSPMEDGARAEIRARLSPQLSHAAGDGSSLVSVLAAGEPALRHRDLERERKMAHALCLSLGLPEGSTSHALDEDALLSLLETMQTMPELEVEWPEQAARTKLLGTVSSLRIRVKSAAEWFGVEGEAEIDGERVKLAQLLAAIRAGKRFVKVGPHRFARIEASLRERLERAADVVFESRKGALSIVPAGGDALEALSDDVLRGDEAWTRIRARLKDDAPIDATVPATLDATLRPYQREGFAWLARLGAIEAGAVLADDMGLGKTIQALALLVHRAPEGPALVITPTSVSDNWVREAARFAPSLRVRLHRGPGRHAALTKSPLGPNDVLIASYDVVTIDQESLSRIELATLVLDEAQWIKNPDAQRSQAVRRMSARVRIALTGTPLENRLSELWSIVSTVHPGLLGPWAHFRGRFAIPIERDGDLDRLRTLSALVRPYLLRRTKEVVAPELPPRIEIVREIELSEGERRLYDAEREAAIAALGDANEDQRFQVLASITRLRQLACDSELVVPSAGLPSSKLATLVEIVEELASSGRRVLVFSQFVRLLERAAVLLDARGITHLMLDGSTPAAERQIRVDRFMRGEATVFLLSLKAGGTGLNLTAADHVVHLDPWWNPAVEDQASDRAHRIGQDKPVTIVRLVAKDTIESQVLALHDDKRALSRGVLDGAELAGSLSASELVAMIRGGEAMSAPSPKRARRRDS